MARYLRQKTGKEPVVVLEATGHYHRGIVAYMERSGFCHRVINPLQSKRAKGTQLRKVKTDATDALYLAEMYYLEMLSLIVNVTSSSWSFSTSQDSMSS